jgi:hypothetical protein
LDQSLTTDEGSELRRKLVSKRESKRKKSNCRRESEIFPERFACAKRLDEGDQASTISIRLKRLIAANTQR